MFRFIAAALLSASPALAGEIAIGPSGMTSEEPFAITAEYKADFDKAMKCPRTSPDGFSFYEGQKAIYAKSGGKVEVWLDEFANRALIDYCE